jgi:hypothetical protein
MPHTVGNDRTLSDMGDSRWAGIGGLAAVGGLALGLAAVVGSGQPEWHRWLFIILVAVATVTLFFALAWTALVAGKALSTWRRGRLRKKAAARRGEDDAGARTGSAGEAGPGVQQPTADQEQHSSGRAKLPRLVVASACAAIIVSVVLAATHLVSDWTGAPPSPGSGGLVYELTFPLKPAGQFTEISLYYGGREQSANYEVDAVYLRAQLNYAPELGLDDPYSLDVLAANASREACATAIIQSPRKSNQIVNLHKGLLFCVRTNSGIALLKVTENLGSSGALHLQETYWPNPGS